MNNNSSLTNRTILIAAGHFTVACLFIQPSDDLFWPKILESFTSRTIHRHETLTIYTISAPSLLPRRLNAASFSAIAPHSEFVPRLEANQGFITAQEVRNIRAQLRNL